MMVSGSKAGARLGTRAGGFWTRQQDVFLNIRVTHPKASFLSRREVISQLLSHEKMKKRPYGERVTAVERGAFTPLVFSTSGMIGKECPMFLKTLACLIAENNVDFHPSSWVTSAAGCHSALCDGQLPVCVVRDHRTGATG